jgi:F-type H+-transporting ATPase subunit b
MAPLSVSALGLAALVPAASEGGFNPLDVGGAGNFVWTLVIFLAAAPFMWRVVMGPIAKALEERDHKASAAIEQAQAASKAAEAARAAVESKLAQAQVESQRMLADAQARAGARERDILAQAESQARAQLESAKAAIEAEKKKALATIRAEVVELSIDGARAVLKRNVGGEDDRRLVADLVGKVKAPSGR